MFLAIGVLCWICGLAGIIWIAVMAIQDGEIVWGVLSLLCGIVAIIYGVQNFERAKIPLLLMLIGVAGNVVVRFVAAGLG